MINKKGKKEFIAKCLILLGVFIIAALVGPFVINYLYNSRTILFITKWNAEDVLAYYGTILAGAFGAFGALIGVYISIQEAQENYREDTRARIRPYISVTQLNKRAKIDEVKILNDPQAYMKQNEKEEDTEGFHVYKNKEKFVVINKDEIEIKERLSKAHQQIIANGGAFWAQSQKFGCFPDRVDFLYIPLEVENIGNGPAILLHIGFRRNGQGKLKFTNPMCLKTGEVYNITIFSTAKNEDISGEYLLTFDYHDISETAYHQEFPIRLKAIDNGDLSQEIDLQGKQTAYSSFNDIYKQEDTHADA